MNAKIQGMVPLAVYEPDVDRLVVGRNSLVDSIIESKHAAPKDDSYTITPEGGHEFKYETNPNFIFKEVWYGGDYEYTVSEVLSAKVSFTGADGAVQHKTIPVWFLEARGWYVKNSKGTYDPTPRAVAGVLGEALRNVPREFPCRGQITPNGVELQDHKGFSYFNTLHPNSSSEDFYAEGVEEITYNGEKCYRGKWRHGLLRANTEDSIVLIGELRKESEVTKKKLLQRAGGFIRRNKNDIAALGLAVVGVPAAGMAFLSYATAAGAQFAIDVMSNFGGVPQSLIARVGDFSSLLYTASILFTGISSSTLTTALILERKAIKNEVVGGIKAVLNFPKQTKDFFIDQAEFWSWLLKRRRMPEHE